MNVLVLLARHWQPGMVKTRLAARCGNKRAAHLHLAFLQTLLARFAGTADERWLAFTPAESRGAFEPLAASDWRLIEQASGDLGQRMAALLASAFARGAARAVLIGSDSPTLPVSHVTQAFELLEQVSVVLGPAGDGGYCLIGAAGGVPPVFEGIDWGTPSVLDQTICCLQAAGLTHALLPTWYDVDTADDLEHLQRELQSATDEQLLALQRAIDEIVNRPD